MPARCLPGSCCLHATAASAAPRTHSMWRRNPHTMAHRTPTERPGASVLTATERSETVPRLPSNTWASAAMTIALSVAFATNRWASSWVRSSSTATPSTAGSAMRSSSSSLRLRRS